MLQPTLGPAEWSDATHCITARMQKVCARACTPVSFDSMAGPFDRFAMLDSDTGAIIIDAIGDFMVDDHESAPSSTQVSSIDEGDEACAHGKFKVDTAVDLMDKGRRTIRCPFAAVAPYLSIVDTNQTCHP